MSLQAKHHAFEFPPVTSVISGCCTDSSIQYIIRPNILRWCHRSIRSYTTSPRCLRMSVIEKEPKLSSVIPSLARSSSRPWSISQARTTIRWSSIPWITLSKKWPVSSPNSPFGTDPFLYRRLKTMTLSTGSFDAESPFHVESDHLNVFDSAFAGSDFEPQHSCRFPIKSGRYVIGSSLYEPDTETALVVHRFISD